MRGKEISWATIYTNDKSVWARRHGTMNTYTSDGNGRIAEEEELVEAGDDNGPYETDKPCAEGGAGHVWVVGVGDGRTDLGIR